jgi:putative restriction endonuclease
MLCLCPDCHVQFDDGAVAITDDGIVVQVFTGEEVGKLRTSSGHKIDWDHIRYHRKHIAGWEY